MSVWSRTSQVFSTRYLEGLASSDSLPNPPPYGHGATPFDAFPSRASSVISTGTRTTLGTLVDDSSSSSQDGFDVHVGGGVYHIALDGRVARASSSHLSGAGWRTSFEFDDDQPYRGIARHRRGALSISPRGSSSGVFTPSRERPERRGSLPGQVGLGQYDRDEPHLDPAGVSRTPSFTPGKESLSVVRPRPAPRARSTTSAQPDEDAEQSLGRLARRGGMKLRVATRDSDDQPFIPGGYPSSAESYETAASHAPEDDENEPPSSPPGFPPTPQDRLSVEALHGDKFRNAKSSENKMLGPEMQIFRRKSSVSHLRRRVSRLTAGMGARHEADFPNEDPASTLEESDAVHDLPAANNPFSAVHDEQEARDHGDGQMRQMIAALARQVLDLKTELAQSHVRVIKAGSDRRHQELQAQSQPSQQASPPVVASPPAPDRHGATEGHSFAFPPLKLNDIKTLKNALKRRAEKIRRGIDDDFGRTPRDSVSSVSSGTEPNHGHEAAEDILGFSTPFQSDQNALQSVSEGDEESGGMSDLEIYLRSSTSGPSSPPASSSSQQPHAASAHQRNQHLEILDLQSRLQESQHRLQKSQQTTAFYAERCRMLEMAHGSRGTEDLGREAQGPRDHEDI